MRKFVADDRLKDGEKADLQGVTYPHLTLKLCPTVDVVPQHFLTSYRSKSREIDKLID